MKEDRMQKMKKKIIYFIDEDVDGEEAWVREKNRSMWAMVDMYVWVIMGLSISKYTEDYNFLSYDAKEIIWNWK